MQFQIMDGKNNHIKILELPQVDNEFVGEVESRIACMLNKSSITGVGGSRWSFLKSVSRLGKLKRYNPKHHKGIPQCQEVVHYRPQLLKLVSSWGTDNPTVVVHSANHSTGESTLELSGIKAIADDVAELVLSHHDRAMINLMDYEDEKMPVTLFISGNPVYNLVASSLIPSDIDPYFFAGLIEGKAVKVVKCLTQELLVPDDCDYVIEGYITKNEMFACSEANSNTNFDINKHPILHITGITHRKVAANPFISELPAENRDDYTKIKDFGVLRERIILQFLKYAADNDIIDLFLSPYGKGTALTVVKIRKRYPCHAAKVAHALWGSNQLMLNKVLIVVDESTSEIRSREQLLDAIASNYTPKSRTLFSRGPADVSDCSTPVKGFGGKICIDATSTEARASIKANNQDAMQTAGQAASRVESPAEIVTKGQVSDESNLSGNNNLSGNISAIKFIHKGDKMPADARIIVVLANETDIDDTVLCMHRLMAEADPIKDSTYLGNQLIIDIS